MIETKMKNKSLNFENRLKIPKTFFNAKNEKTHYTTLCIILQIRNRETIKYLNVITFNNQTKNENNN